MAPLLLAFVAAFLCQWGERSQWLVAELAARQGRPAAVLTGAALAACAAAVLAGLGGGLLHPTLAPRALSLLLALALGFAGLEGLIGGRRGKPFAQGWRTGPLLGAAFGWLLLGLYARSQFVTAAIAAQFGAPLLAAAGAAVGTIAGLVPAAGYGDAFERALPVRPIRIGIAFLLLVVAFVIAVNALRLT